MSTSSKIDWKNFFSTTTAVLIGGLGLFILGIFLWIMSYQIKYVNRVFPGISIAGIDVSGLNREEMEEKLTNLLTYPADGDITLSFGQNTWDYAPDDLGLSLDMDANFSQLFKVGRSGLPWERLADQMEAYQSGIDFSPKLIFDGISAHQEIEEIAAIINRPVMEADLYIENGSIKSTLGQTGITVDTFKTAALLYSYFLNLQNGEVAIQYNQFEPEVMDVSEQIEIAESIISQPLTIRYAEEEDEPPETWTYPTNDLIQMLDIARIGSDEGVYYQIGLNTATIAEFLRTIEPKLVIEPKDAIYYFDDDTRELVVIENATVGRALDIQGTIDHINKQLAEGEHTIDLIFAYEEPFLSDTRTAADLGITELVQAYTSYYHGSSTARIQNITTAAAQFHGILIPPGATFSMAENIGDISLDTGYAESLIIFGDRTIEGVGGGVCQVSTTLFRTAFFAGFPIEERYPHAYRVSYYEKKSNGTIDKNLAGLDATVYAPIVDFKFTNDTDYWLLMETYVYPGSKSITWKFYSTSDGRTVEWDTTGLTNVVEAPDPVYEENPDLKKGEVDQVDWEVDGADVTVTRVVYRDDAVLFGDTFRTHYRPWGAVYEYGPGTKDMPPDKDKDKNGF